MSTKYTIASLESQATAVIQANQQRSEKKKTRRERHGTAGADDQPTGGWMSPSNATNHSSNSPKSLGNAASTAGNNGNGAVASSRVPVNGVVAATPRHGSLVGTLSANGVVVVTPVGNLGTLTPPTPSRSRLHRIAPTTSASTGLALGDLPPTAFHRLPSSPVHTLVDTSSTSNTTITTDTFLSSTTSNAASHPSSHQQASPNLPTSSSSTAPTIAIGSGTVLNLLMGTPGGPLAPVPASPDDSKIPSPQLSARDHDHLEHEHDDDDNYDADTTIVGSASAGFQSDRRSLLSSPGAPTMSPAIVPVASVNRATPDLAHNDGMYDRNNNGSDNSNESHPIIPPTTSTMTTITSGIPSDNVNVKSKSNANTTATSFGVFTINDRTSNSPLFAPQVAPSANASAVHDHFMSTPPLSSINIPMNTPPRPDPLPKLAIASTVTTTTGSTIPQSSTLSTNISATTTEGSLVFTPMLRASSLDQLQLEQQSPQNVHVLSHHGSEASASGDHHHNHNHRSAHHPL
jgi:hypothetical protein